ncbi:LytTR family transcriptional regulator [Sphingomonas sp. RB56-2]|uniref:LytTR family transcriptional regulator n=1 Tax=Sphingomonas brevis TaxID=2908206 RepID=A0ABT0SBN5_9SPHN|nr:LytTR family DNA-binding domain-containing protein [Sphingomonas brevis]MCL6741825.1 LytTR family transcriptional regulator [Sphingomonas brevis]
MASRAPRLNLTPYFFEPLRRGPLLAAGIAVWLLGAAYCHGYQALMTGESVGPWSGSLTWSAVAVVPWFALFEWSKQPHGADTVRRPALLAGLVLAIAAASIALEYLVDFCLGDVTDHLGLLMMRRLPAIGVTILLIVLTRKAMLRRPPAAATIGLKGLAPSIDWIEAADNYVEAHVGSRTILFRMTMAGAERDLAGLGFVRIHRRFLINRGRVDRMLGSNGDRRILIAGKELPVGSRYAAGLRP